MRLYEAVLRKKLLRVNSREVRFDVRGFPCQHQHKRVHLEHVGGAFLDGYHAALDHESVESCVARLNNVGIGMRGFAVEGASMAIWLLDSLINRRHRKWDQFYERVCVRQPYIAHVGVGWALAKLPWTKRHPERYLDRFDSTLKWLVIDGYGFHEGYFRTRRWVEETEVPKWLSTYGRRVFDQGLGRSLWFVCGADPSQIVMSINRFAEERHRDLWSGVGLACSYAGGCTPQEISSLMTYADGYCGHFQQGVAFGCEARARAGSLTENSEVVCALVCGRSASEVARLTRETQIAAKESTGPVELYELWRERLRAALTICERKELVPS
jgi:enediyne biosynthesis protein E3